MNEKTESNIVKPEDPNFINPGSPNLIRLYANSFTVGPTMSDMYIIGVLNNAPSFVVNMSFETAKTLHQSLEKLIIDFEKKAEMNIMTMMEIQNTYLKNESQK